MVNLVETIDLEESGAFKILSIFLKHYNNGVVMHNKDISTLFFKIS